MKICFVNANRKVTFVSGSVVYTPETTERTASLIVSTWLAGQREFGVTEEQRNAADAVEALILSDCGTASLRELEKKGDPRIRVFNRNPHVPSRLTLNR